MKIFLTFQIQTTRIPGSLLRSAPEIKKTNKQKSKEENGDSGPIISRSRTATHPVLLSPLFSSFAPGQRSLSPHFLCSWTETPLSSPPGQRSLSPLFHCSWIEIPLSSLPLLLDRDPSLLSSFYPVGGAENKHWSASQKQHKRGKRKRQSNSSPLAGSQRMEWCRVER